LAFLLAQPKCGDLIARAALSAKINGLTSKNGNSNCARKPPAAAAGESAELAGIHLQGPQSAFSAEVQQWKLFTSRTMHSAGERVENLPLGRKWRNALRHLRRLADPRLGSKSSALATDRQRMQSEIQSMRQPLFRRK
jgi:hypothetical protein